MPHGSVRPPMERAHCYKRCGRGHPAECSRGGIMTKSLIAPGAIALLLGLAACTNPYDPGQRAVGGGLLGAGAGAALGAAAGGGRGAAIGAAAGGAPGAVTRAATTPPPPGHYPPPRPHPPPPPPPRDRAARA